MHPLVSAAHLGNVGGPAGLPFAFCCLPLPQLQPPLICPCHSRFPFCRMSLEEPRSVPASLLEREASGAVSAFGELPACCVGPGACMHQGLFSRRTGDAWTWHCRLPWRGPRGGGLLAAGGHCSRFRRLLSLIEAPTDSVSDGSPLPGQGALGAFRRKNSDPTWGCTPSTSHSARQCRRAGGQASA